MAFCANCGTQLQDGVKFCPACGHAVESAQTQQQADNTPHDYTQPIFTGEARQSGDDDAQNNKAMAIIAYILFFIPLLVGAHKTSPFVKYHANQGLVLFLAALAWGVVYWIVIALLTALLLHAATWGLWSVLTTILAFVWLLPTVLCILGIINAAGGKMKPLPVIGGITLLK